MAVKREPWMRFVPYSIPSHSRQYSLSTEFLRLCWIDDEETDAVARTGTVAEVPSYRDWLVSAGGFTASGAPRASTPKFVRHRSASSTCSQSSVVGTDLTQSTCSGPGWTSQSTPTMNGNIPDKAISWRTASTNWESKEERRQRHLTKAERDMLMEPSPALEYRPWVRQTTQACSDEPRSPGKRLQRRENCLLAGFDDSSGSDMEQEVSRR
ncbi:uncharacterized protein LOC144162133 [Haemaphysalis longicornis]